MDRHTPEKKCVIRLRFRLCHEATHRTFVANIDVVKFPFKRFAPGNSREGAFAVTTNTGLIELTKKIHVHKYRYHPQIESLCPLRLACGHKRCPVGGGMTALERFLKNYIRIALATG
jgi:hypothetical protein